MAPARAEGSSGAPKAQAVPSVPRAQSRAAWHKEVSPGMNIIVWIIVGAIAGFLAGKVVTGHGLGLIWDIVVGIIGAFIGGWLAGLAGIAVTNIVVEIVVAFVG